MNGLINKKKYREQKGMSILEALVASVIVGIGFIAIFQMVNYSVTSINVSGERTKANYLVSMIAEGMIGYKDTVGGVTEADRKNIVYENGKAYLVKEGVKTECKKFAEFYKDLGAEGSSGCSGGDTEIKRIEINTCTKKEEFSTANDYTEINNVTDPTDKKFDDASGNNVNKWQNIIGEDQLLKCRSPKEFKSVKMYQMCAWSGGDACEIKNTKVFDESMYLGKIQINLNDGKKRKFLYFQADYLVKQDEEG